MSWWRRGASHPSLYVPVLILQLCDGLHLALSHGLLLVPCGDPGVMLMPRGCVDGFWWLTRPLLDVLVCNGFHLLRKSGGWHNLGRHSSTKSVTFIRKLLQQFDPSALSNHLTSWPIWVCQPKVYQEDTTLYGVSGDYLKVEFSGSDPFSGALGT